MSLFFLINPKTSPWAMYTDTGSGSSWEKKHRKDSCEIVEVKSLLKQGADAYTTETENRVLCFKLISAHITDLRKKRRIKETKLKAKAEQMRQELALQILAMMEEEEQMLLLLLH